MSLLFLALLVLPPRDTVLRFPLVTVEIGETSLDDRLSDIWASVVPVVTPPTGIAGGIATTPRSKWFAIGSFGEGGDSLMYGVVLDSTAPTLKLVIRDGNHLHPNGERVVTLARPAPEGAPTVSARVTVGRGGTRRGVRFSVDARGRLDWRPDDRWDTLLRLGSGTLSVRILPFERTNWITFMDHDNDGLHDRVLPPTEVVALGGYFWTWMVDPSRHEMLLTRTTREPVIVGYRAPAATAKRDSIGPETPLIAARVRTLLIFCYVGCEGCKLAIPAIDTLLGRAGTGGDRRVVVVAKGSSDRAAYEAQVGMRMQVVLGAEAWEHYAVMPTPTFVEIDGSGMIVWRDEGWSDAALGRVAAFLGTTRR